MAPTAASPLVCLAIGCLVTAAAKESSQIYGAIERSASVLASAKESSQFYGALERPASIPVIPETHGKARGLEQYQERQTQSLEATCEIIKDAYLGTSGVERAACQECYIDPENPEQYILFCDFANYCSICSEQNDVCYNLTRRHTVQLWGNRPDSPRGVAYSACGQYTDKNDPQEANVCLDETYDTRGFIASRCVSVDGVSCQTCEMDYQCGRFWFECSNIEEGFWMHDCDYSINDTIPKSSVFIGFNYAVYDADTQSCFDESNGQLGNIPAPTSAPSMSNAPSFYPSVSVAPSIASSGPTITPSLSNSPSLFPSVSEVPSISSSPSEAPSDWIEDRSSEPSREPTLEPSTSPSLHPSTSPSESSFPSMVPSTSPSNSMQPSSIPTNMPSWGPSSAPTNQVSVQLETFSITLSASSEPPKNRNLAQALSDFFFAQFFPSFPNLSHVVVRPLDQSSNTYRFEGEAVFYQSAPSPGDVLEHEATTLGRLERLEDEWIVSDAALETDFEEGSTASPANHDWRLSVGATIATLLFVGY